MDKNKNLYLAFIDIEKTFHRLPCKVLWSAMQVVGVPEWIVAIVQAMYNGAKVNGSLLHHYTLLEQYKLSLGTSLCWWSCVN